MTKDKEKKKPRKGGSNSGQDPPPPPTRYEATATPASTDKKNSQEDNSVRNTSQYGTLSAYSSATGGKSTPNTNTYKGPSFAQLKERIKSEGVPIVTANADRFSETELKTIEEFLNKRNGLRWGDTIESGSRRYKVGSVIGEGRYCDVYVATEEKEDEEEETSGRKFAVKVDKRKHEYRTRQKIEVSVFDKIRSSIKADSNYRFPEYIESGISRAKPFIIMNVLGPNLSRIREKAVRRSHNYERRTAYLIALETLRAIRDLHKLGFIHRDIKPANFCIGAAPANQDKVYLIDFASAARIEDNNQLELLRMEKAFPPRDQNLVFCAPEAHRGEILTRRSDLLSWFYLVVDAFDRDLLRWKKWEDSDKILEAKIAFWKDRSSQLSPLPRTLQELAAMIEEHETPRYDKMLYMINDEKKELDARAPTKRYEWSGLNI